jgi:hypothetical protein
LLSFDTLFHGFVAARSGRAEEKKCLRSLKHWYLGFETHSRHGCPSFFCVYVVLHVGSRLGAGLITRLRILPTVCKIHSSRLILVGNKPEGLMQKKKLLFNVTFSAA